MAMLIDLHNHTSPASDDSVLDVEVLIGLAKERGLDGVAITDHDYFWDTKKLTPFSERDLIAMGQRNDLLVIPAVEINTDDGHLICFALEEYVFGMHHTLRTRGYVDAKGGAMILAHPYRRQIFPEDNERKGWVRSIAHSRDNPIWKVVDAVEVMNGRGIGDENTFSQAMARELGLRGVASSDAHKPDDVAVCATLFYDDIGDRWDLIRALKSGRFEPVRVDRFAPPDLKEALRAADFEPTPSNGQVPRNLEDIVRAV